MIDEARIREEVGARHRGALVEVSVDWWTPAGRARKAPMYESFIENSYLGATRVVKGKTASEAELKAKQQIEKWAAQEVRKRIS